MNSVSTSSHPFDLTQTRGMVAVLNDDGYIREVNDALPQFFGYTKCEILNLNFASLVVPEEQEKAVQYCKEAAQGIPVYGHLAFYTACGDRKVMNLVLTPMLQNGVINGAYLFMKDVTENVVKNKKVHDSEQRLAAIVNTAMESIQVLSIKGDLLDINGAGLQLLGFNNSTEIIGQSFLPFIHTDDRARFKNMHHLVCLGQNGNLQYRLYNSQQEMQWVETNAVPLKDKYNNIYATLSVTRNISEKKLAETALYLSEQKFRSLVQNGSDLIFVIDEEAHIQYVSPAVKNIAGYNPDELLGKQAFELIHADDLSIILNELKNIKTFTNDGIATAHRFLTSNGDWIWLESKGANLLHDNNVKGLVINSRDVTDRILLQQKLDAELADRQRKITSAVIKAQESERSQLGQELHDNVNQVLTTIKLYNEMLAGDIGPRDEILKKSTRYLQLCIDEIRSISKRLSAPTLGKINLTESVLELVDSINLTNKLTIHYAFDGIEIDAISQDVHLTIYRIIQEQLNNILKHANAQHVFIEISNTAQHLMLVIRDDGNGFNANQKRLGIGITNMITRAENMNGHLSIKTALNQGCVLTVTLPPQNLCTN